jgi:hypothetical protein
VFLDYISQYRQAAIGGLVFVNGGTAGPPDQD